MTEEKVLRKYELMFILSPMLTEDKRRSTVKELNDLITSNGGEIFHEEDMGKQELAYTIKKHDEGYYMLYYFTLENGEFISELEHHIKLDNGIIRHIVIRREDSYEIVDYNAMMEEMEAAKEGEVSTASADEVMQKPKKAAAPKAEAPAKKEEPAKEEAPKEKEEPAKPEGEELDKKLADIISDSDIEV